MTFEENFDAEIYVKRSRTSSAPAQTMSTFFPRPELTRPLANLQFDPAMFMQPHQPLAASRLRHVSDTDVPGALETVCRSWCSCTISHHLSRRQMTACTEDMQRTVCIIDTVACTF